MRNYIRDNSKKLLAVMGVILMVAWAVPSGMKSGNAMMNARRVYGTAGTQKVFDADIARSKQQWEFLQEVIMISPEATGGKEESIGNRLRQTDQVFEHLAEQLPIHPELYYLLQLEADRMGVIVTDAQIDSAFKASKLAVRLQTTGRPIVDYDEGIDPDFKNETRDAFGAFMKVRQAFDRAMTTPKISRPYRQQSIEREIQQIQIADVEFSANDYLAQVAPPTEDQLKSQFDKFSDFQAERTSPENPHGFGYKHPNRVTLQYVGLRREDVVQAVRASRPDAEWDVDARRHYLKHRDEFKAMPPASTQPTTQPATTQPTTTQPATTQHATSAPTTQPYDDVKQQILDVLMAPEVKHRFVDAQTMIHSRLDADWKTWNAAHPQATTLPTSNPAPTTAPTGFASFEYLQKLAADVQKQTGVLPVIAAVNQYQSAADLEKLPGIGAARANQLTFAQYATELPAGVLPVERQNEAVVLKDFQPSQPLVVETGSIYIFRITSALPASRPASMSEVAEPVARDFKITRAYDLAKENAQTLLNSAIKTGSLPTAATLAGKKAITSGLFTASSPTIENLNLDEKATPRFLQAALDLLSTAATQPTPPPMKLIELPVQMKVEVTQLLLAKPAYNLAEVPMLDGVEEERLMQSSAVPIAQSWYDFSSVVARLKWKEDASRKSKDHDQN